MICFQPILALLAVVTLQPNAHHTSNMNGVQVEAQTCATGVGAYATALSSELYTGGIQYGYPVQLTEQVSLIGQVFVGAAYPTRWVPEMPNGVTFDTGVRVLMRWKQVILETAWQHNSDAGLGQRVQRGDRIYGNTGLDIVKVGLGWEF